MIIVGLASKWTSHLIISQLIKEWNLCLQIPLVDKAVVHLKDFHVGFID